jgi:hypothetical protein
LPRTTTAAAERLTDVFTHVLGPDWAPPAAPHWPATFTHKTTGRQFSLALDHHRLLLITTVPGTPEGRAWQRSETYTPDLAGHATLASWVADGDLHTAVDALAVIVERLLQHPLPERDTAPDPLETERERLAERAMELNDAASKFCAGIIWSRPVAADAHLLAELARNLSETATRVDELRGCAPNRSDQPTPPPARQHLRGRVRKVLTELADLLPGN